MFYILGISVVFYYECENVLESFTVRAIQKLFRIFTAEAKNQEMQKALKKTSGLSFDLSAERAGLLS